MRSSTGTVGGLPYPETASQLPAAMTAEDDNDDWGDFEGDALPVSEPATALSSAALVRVFPNPSHCKRLGTATL